MSARTLAAFSTIRTEGAMLPSDILVRVAAGDTHLGGLEGSSYHLAPGEKIGEATNRAWNRLQAAWANFQSAREKLAATDTGTSLTRERWLLPLFQLLDYGRLQAAKAEDIGGKSYAISHAWQQTPIHLVGCNVDLDRRIQTAAGGMRSSPHSLLQELLNRADQHLWGIVSNGVRLRLLRDNISLTRQAYVEFDLEAMMAGEAYPDFVLLWLLLHQSRFEAERPEQCQLEKWSQTARTEGVRVLDGLRDGVQRSIEHLGQGFLAHPANTALREHLRSGALDKQDYYRQILRLVYRLLFLFVADDRDLLLAPTADPVAQKRYRDFYATTRLRRLATTRAGSRHHDLYCGLKLVMEKLSGDGCPELALPALGSFLFSPRALPDLNACDISNLHLLEAIRSLAVTQTGQSRRVVDYKNLGAEELGSVYESLLELHPDLNAEAASFELKVAAGSERKKTGSYYTPTSLISCLLDSALDPVLLEAASLPEPEAAILKLKVVDPACGSGHFLIAAAHRIAKRLAAVRTGEEEPPPEAQHKAIRDVIGHCIYGVDVNPMAVELCKVSLWMEALEPGKPLSFLEHRIQCGNSLLGTTPALLAQGIPDEAFTPIEGDEKEICKEFKRINKEERNKQMRLFAATTEPWQQLGNFAASLMNLDTVGDDSIDAIREKERMYETAIRSGDYLDGRFWADAWCAAFVWKKTREFKYPVTEEVFRRIERNPHSCEFWMREETERLARQYRFFHWHLAFPEVFQLPSAGATPENQKNRWNSGFSAVIGNPPWERVKLQDREWFASIRPEIANASSAAIRKKLITDLKVSDPGLHLAYLDSSRTAEGEAHFAQHSGRYELAAGGDTNTYPLFIELADGIIRGRGKIGMIVKTGILADYSLRGFFQYLVEGRKLRTAYDFSNKKLIFPAVVANERFTLLTLTGGGDPAHQAMMSILNDDVSGLLAPGAVWRLTAEDINLLNPNTRTAPLFQSEKDMVVVREIYNNHAILARVAGGREVGAWGAKYYTMFHMTNDSGIFVDLESLQDRSQLPPSPSWETESGRYSALWEGKLFDSFHYRHGDFRGVPRASRFGVKAEPNHPSSHDLLDPSIDCLPRYWVPNEEVRKRYADQLGYVPTAVLAFRDVCRVHTDLRTVRACVVPAWGAGNKAPLLLFPGLAAVEHGRRSLFLCTVLNSFVFDYVTRQKFSGGSLNKYVLIQLPVVNPPSGPCPWNPDLLLDEWILNRALELSATGNDLTSLSNELSRGHQIFRHDAARRFLLQCELDAAYFHLYGIQKCDSDYILETFPIFRRNDEAAYGEYRTKRVILEIYDAMAEAERAGVPYETRLDPPPADPRVAHSPSTAGSVPVQRS